MGRIKSSEDINTPEAFKATAPPPQEQVASFPPMPEPLQVEGNRTPTHFEREVEGNRTPTHFERGVEGNRTPTHFERVTSFPPRSQQEDDGVEVFPPVSKLDHIQEIGPPPVNFGHPTPGLPLPLGNPWTTGLFDCCEDPTNAVMTSIFPCVTFGQLAEILQSGNTTCATGSFLYLLTMPLLVFPAVMGANYRNMLRTKFGLVEAPYPDLFTHLCCLCCALCQEFRELKNRGFDPNLGWNGLMAQQMMHGNNQMNTPPPQQGMFK